MNGSGMEPLQIIGDGCVIIPSAVIVFSITVIESELWQLGVLVEETVTLITSPSANGMKSVGVKTADVPVFHCVALTKNV